MSSANEQLPPPPKPRMSPLDFRNTDLVSRLLAATPPYLYNMSLLPNTYFFSEMLRSFVQAKSDPSRPSSTPFQTRRTRKRPWTPVKNESYSKSSSPPKSDQPSDWSMKSSYTDTKSMDTPLELTTAKISVMEGGESDPKLAKTSFGERKVEMPLQEQVEPLYSSVGESAPSGLILPPPPPMWYPSLYPAAAPYGIDPLHFFIDLRVSGHIYDKKRETEAEKTETEEKQVKEFKQSRHASAFSVPTPRGHRPANHNEEESEARSTRFDVKSMGFEKASNKTGVSYVMSNVASIYKNVTEMAQRRVKSETGESENDNETEEQREKRVKDLRALIGLELVVDYMNHAKPNPRRIQEQDDTESSASPTLEVVAVHDET